MKTIEQILEIYIGTTKKDWHEHKNAHGSKGGWIYKDAIIEEVNYIHADAVIWGGVIRGGVIWGGVIRGGVIRGGVIRGGEIWGGEIWGGVWKYTPLFITGTKNTVSHCNPNHIQIGCHCKTIAEWKKEYKAIGKRHNYTTEEIKEYYDYILLVEKADKRIFGKEKKAS